MNQSSSEAAHEALALTLLDVASRIERRLDRAVAAVRGISFSEFRLLRALSGFPHGTATRVALADAVALTPSAVTRSLKPLEKLGIVTTERSERDARYSLARLTPAGEGLLADARRAIGDAVRAMPLDGRDAAYLQGFLEDLGARWRREG